MVITQKVVKYPDRAESDRFFNYPYAAIEEALSNAVYHRAYDEREPIEVRVENDRIEIVSFPGPDRSVTIEGLKCFRVSNRRYRNRRIGDFLKELHLTEGRNTGFKKILDALEANGSPKPEFETDEDRSYFITRLFIHEAFDRDMVERKMSDKVSDKVSDKMTEKEKLFFEMLVKSLKVEDYVTTSSMSNITNIPISTVRRYMIRFCELGILYSEGKNKGTKYYWKNK